MRQLPALACLILLIAGCEYIPFSNTKLKGALVPKPQSWSSVAEASIIQFETRPQDPYSVNLWVLGMDGFLYVYAGDNRTEWVTHIEANPNVRLGHENRIYELTATQVTEEVEFKTFAQGWADKYGNLPRNMNLSEVYLYRLTERE